MKVPRLPSIVSLLGVFLLARSKLGQAAGEAEKMATALMGVVGLRQRRSERGLHPHTQACLRSTVLTLLGDSGFSGDEFPS